MSEQSANIRLAKNSLYMSLQTILVLIITLYTTRVVLKVLGVENYGIYNVVSGFVSMFAFLNTSMASAVQRYFNFELGQNGEEGATVVYNAAIRIHIILAIILIIATESIGLWYLRCKMVLPEGRLVAAEYIFHMSVASLFVNVIEVPYLASVMAHEKLGFYAAIGTIDAVLKLCIAIALPFIAGDKLIWYGILFFGISIFNFLSYLVYSKKKFTEIHYRKNIPASIFKELLSFSGWGILGTMSYVLREQGVNLVLNSFFGTVVNAARGIAFQVNSALQSFVNSLVAPSRPQVIQAYSQGNMERSRNLTYSISKLTCLFFYAMTLPICFEIDYILHIWLGNSIPEHTPIFIIMLLATNTFGTFVAPLSTIVQAAGRIKFYQILTSISNFMTVPLAYAFLLVSDAPEYVFVALFITMCTNVLTGLISAKKCTGLTYLVFFRKILSPVLTVILISLPLSVIPVLLLNEGIIRFIVEILWSTSIVVVTSYLWALSKEEKAIVSLWMHKIAR